MIRTGAFSDHYVNDADCMMATLSLIADAVATGGDPVKECILSAGGEQLIIQALSAGGSSESAAQLTELAAKALKAVGAGAAGTSMTQCVLRSHVQSIRSESNSYTHLSFCA